MQCIHFVGFRHDSEYLSAVKVFGKPHFIHYVHDKRMYQEIDASKDVVCLLYTSPSPRDS